MDDYLKIIDMPQGGFKARHVPGIIHIIIERRIGRLTTDDERDVFKYILELCLQLCLLQFFPSTRQTVEFWSRGNIFNRYRKKKVDTRRMDVYEEFSDQQIEAMMEKSLLFVDIIIRKMGFLEPEAEGAMNVIGMEGTSIIRELSWQQRVFMLFHVMVFLEFLHETFSTNDHPLAGPKYQTIVVKRAILTIFMKASMELFKKAVQDGEVPVNPNFAERNVANYIDKFLKLAERRRGAAFRNIEFIIGKKFIDAVAQKVDQGVELSRENFNENMIKFTKQHLGFVTRAFSWREVWAEEKLDNINFNPRDSDSDDGFGDITF